MGYAGGCVGVDLLDHLLLLGREGQKCRTLEIHVGDVLRKFPLRLLQALGHLNFLVLLPCLGFGQRVLLDLVQIRLPNVHGAERLLQIVCAGVVARLLKCPDRGIDRLFVVLEQSCRADRHARLLQSLGIDDFVELFPSFLVQIVGLLVLGSFSGADP